jgi:RNA polymerase sigma factor (sigma-70 family)
MGTAPRKAKATDKGRFSDAHLVKQCLRGSEAAWSTLISKYKNLIYSIPVRYGFSQADSADIFQVVCLDLLNELPRLREPNALAGWLIQVTRNRCFHEKTAQQKQQPLEIEDQAAQAAIEEPENLVVQTEREQQLRNAMLDLSPRCQKLLQMLFFEMPTRPYEEVAKNLDLALGSIGFIRRRCLDKLRVRLEQLGG